MMVTNWAAATVPTVITFIPFCASASIKKKNANRKERRTSTITTARNLVSIHFCKFIVIDLGKNNVRDSMKTRCKSTLAYREWTVWRINIGTGHCLCTIHRILVPQKLFCFVSSAGNHFERWKYHCVCRMQFLIIRCAARKIPDWEYRLRQFPCENPTLIGAGRARFNCAVQCYKRSPIDSRIVIAQHSVLWLLSRLPIQHMPKSVAPIDASCMQGVRSRHLRLSTQHLPLVYNYIIKQWEIQLSF